MSDKEGILPEWKTGTILILGILVVVLVCAGCTGTSSPANTTGPETSVPTVAATRSVPEACTFDRQNVSPEADQPGLDPCYFSSHTPLEYINDLETNPGNQVMVLSTPTDWITLRDVAQLMELIDSGEPASPVVSPLSSYSPFNQTSTVGTEALFLIEGYRTGHYPPGLSSLYYFKPNRTEVREWWDMYGKQDPGGEKAAIRIIQDANPDLLAYPSDIFPTKAILTQKAPDGWYVAFIVEGSGVPIVSARCYYVGNDRKLRLMQNVNQSIMVMPQDFSAETCG